ncbi:putative T7SS-secreted protein [Streptomyces sp. NPDC102467]|uniref:putative T7SS-secreted protein n=1 Tax=Streptomyces sp. NPDC102467 TaxID=3366179 RepID=UPI00382127D4
MGGNRLGWTDDPKDLVPGDAGKLGGVVTTFNGWSTKFEAIGDGLRDLKVPGWTGQASDVFWPTLSKEKKDWYLAADAMSDAAKAVTSYSSTLSWAQQQARTAIHKWDKGEHDAAEEVLEAAKKQLKTAAEKLTKALGNLAGDAKDSPKWLAEAKDYVDARQWAAEHGTLKTSQTRWTWANEKWRTRADGTEQNTRKVWGKDENGNWFIKDQTVDPTAPPQSNKPGVNVKLAEWQGSADAWSLGTSGDGKVGVFDVKGNAGISTLGVSAGAGAGFVDGQLQANASGSAYLAQASATGSAEYGIVAGQAEGKAFVGADVSTNLGVGKDGLHAGAEAFAGAKATGSVSADVGGVGAGASGEAWAGVGASASADLGMKDGKFTIGGDLGVGLGVGGKVSVDITVDPGKVVDTAEDAVDAVGDAWDSTVGGWF